MLPLQARVNQGAMAMTGYSAFPKAPTLLEPHHQIVSCHNQDTRWVGGVVLPVCRDAVGIFSQPQPTGLVYERYGKGYISIVKNTFPETDYSVG